MFPCPASVLRGRCHLTAAFHYQRLLKFRTVSIYQCRFIVRVEEFLFPELYDLLVEPVQKSLISLSYRRRDGVRTAQ